VRTAGVLTRVLGTTFDIRRYPGDADGRVIVWSGKVATGARNASMTLTAGMAGRFTDSTVIGAAANDSTTFTDWARGRLVFKNAPVPVVLATLHEWYGYEFRLSDPAMAEQYVSAEFTAGDTHEMLNIVAHMLGVNVTLRDSVLLLQPARSALSPKHPMERRRDNFLSTPTEVGR